ncbi:uncharacterized protein N7529_006380 [Penicillium soppii]|uniref:uncharacterized protein n=1 Tax=Penicillium soppii TaxID=69789 RepID=UPI002549AEC4|nr:uncharacterized protein N7529_006380 [Penicillium soppii]KAJ5864464.1 hypothetical protein N7529_006380 [Penicillium soppii]
MSEQPKHRKGSFGGFMDRMLHPGHHDNKDHPNQDKDNHEPQHEDEPKKESEADKFKDYIKKDEQMEEEGRTYGGLM